MPKYERQTGEEHYNDILRNKPIQDENSFCEFLDAKDKCDFKSAICHILSNLKEGDIITLHFETHGSEAGLYLASGEIVGWREFFDILRPINIAIGHLLFVVMSMCYNVSVFQCFSVVQH